MSQPQLELADIFRQYGEQYRQAYPLSYDQLRVMRAIEQCRTAALGGHVDQCDSCGQLRISYNSCRNRHCPKCQSLAKFQWLEARMAELLPVGYFHVVFTLPDSLAAIALQNKRQCYNILFQAVAETLLKIAADEKYLGAQIGFIAVLHTWGQQLLLHPHIHCIVPGGGISPDGKSWLACRAGFFLPVRVLSRLFRGLFLHYLERAFDEGKLAFAGTLANLADQQTFANLLNSARQQQWVVYAKQPFGGPEQVLNYLGQYTHRVAIANHRLVSADAGLVSFRWKDYADNNSEKVMTLEAAEFIRRFLLHVLPTGFQRIRYYGFLANCQRTDKLAQARQLLGVGRETITASQPAPAVDWKTIYQQLTGVSLDLCPVCQRGQMRLRLTLLPEHGPLYQYDSS
jgi:hypothetical protein